MPVFTRTIIVALLLIGSFTFSPLFAQKEVLHKQIFELVKKHATVLNLPADDIENAVVTSAYHDNFLNCDLGYLQQTFKSVPVYNNLKVVAFRDGKLMSSAGSFIRKISSQVNIADAVPVIAPAAAVNAAASSLDLNIVSEVGSGVRLNGGRKIEFSYLGISQEHVIAQLLWIPAENTAVRLAWQIKILPPGSSDHWLISVDAATGTILRKDNLTVSCNWDEPELPGTDTKWKKVVTPTPAEWLEPAANSTIGTSRYRVIPFPAESINHSGGVPKVVVDPWNAAPAGSPATTLGWHNSGSVYHDSTRGNNVWVKEDRAGNNGNPIAGRTTVSTTTAPSLTFDFPFSTDTTPTSLVNQNFAMTQLFYWSNLMHDISYLYGFDEVSGNFQNSNLGRGGAENDYLLADAQDGSGSNNANFTTPEDGKRPRMQMFLFNASSKTTLSVNHPSSLAGFKNAIESSFSTNNKLSSVGPVTGDVVLYKSGDTNLACSTLIGTPLNGKVALIDRGTCNFTVKVKNAEEAGAIAVIIANNVAGEPIIMTGSENTITIPAVMISQADGDALKSALQAQNVNVTLKAGIDLDGDLDNGIVAHEYAHGISHRLTGGPANSTCLINVEQMGEGWSDYYALMTTTNWASAKLTDGPNKRPIGTFVFDQDPVTGGGIRTFPYSTDININPWTYSMLADNTGGRQHTVGEIWAQTLWDMTWNIIELDGINPNIYNVDETGGNSVSLKLVTQAMKLQPCRPGFIDGRDAILKADSILYNGKYSCAIWNAFAKRGMGIRAEQGSSDKHTDQLADFNVPAAIVKISADKSDVASNEEISYTLKASCLCTGISNYKIIDTLPSNVRHLSGGSYNSTDRTVSFNVPGLTPGKSHSFQMKVKVNNGSYASPKEVLNEIIPTTSIPSGWAVSSTGRGSWSVSNARSHSAAYSFKALDVDTLSTQTLTSRLLNVSGISNLSFWHYFNTEPTYDGGVVEVSIDSGTTWIDAGKYMTQNGYNSTLGADSKRGFSGSTNGQFVQTVINLSSFKNRALKIRFVFTTDPAEGGDGWYVDDIILKTEAGVYNHANLFNAAYELQSVADISTTINSTLLPVVNLFTVEKVGAKAIIKWSTSDEHNLATFVVQRSADGVHFESISSVNAISNSSIVTDYSSTDQLPLSGINYYRIQQINRDGKFAYTTLRSVSFDDLRGQITVTPNPTRDRITITVPGNQRTINVSLSNALGQHLTRFTINGQYNQYLLPTLPAGTYYLRISGEIKPTVKKLIIE